MSLRPWLRASYGGIEKAQRIWKVATSISARTCLNTMMSAKPSPTSVLITMATASKVLHVVAAAIFNKQGDLLVAQRPLDKHMGGCGNFLVVRWRPVKPLLMLCAVSWTKS